MTGFPIFYGATNFCWITTGRGSDRVGVDPITVLSAQRDVLHERNATGSVGSGGLARLLNQFEERFDDVDRHRKDYGGILLGADLCQCLQVAQLHGGWDAREYLGGIDEGLRSLELGFGMDDLGAAVALRFGLLRDSADHVLGELDGSDLDVAYLDPPGLGLAINDTLHIGAELFSFGQHLIEFVLPQHGA